MIDILMATYNGEQYIAEQLDSLLNQTFTNWQLIVHDDGSVDNTINIIKQYIENYPDKICLIDDGIRTGGAKNNFLHVMQFSKAPYIMFCDQDDVWLPNKIELTYKAMIEHEKQKGEKVPLLVHTDLCVVDSKLNIIAPSMIDYQKLRPDNGSEIILLAIENCITGCTMMVNRTLLNISLKMPNHAMMHDWWMGLMALQHRGTIKFLNISTLLYRQHEVNTVGAKKVTYFFYLKKIFSIKKIFMQYNTIRKQYIAAGIKISYYDFFILKVRSIYRKLMS